MMSLGWISSLSATWWNDSCNTPKEMSCNYVWQLAWIHSGADMAHPAQKLSMPRRILHFRVCQILLNHNVHYLAGK